MFGAKSLGAAKSSQSGDLARHSVRRQVCAFPNNQSPWDFALVHEVRG